MKQKQRKRRFNFAHRVKTFRVTSEMADFMNSLGVSERAAFFGHALRDYITRRGVQ
jgi:hypothetical protein